MAFKYSCFISYCHGQYDLVKGFIDQLKTALKAELETLLDEEVYIDEERLKPGFKYNEALAMAICESVCMIVVYSPKYERHEYCMREFEGMQRLEKERLKLLGGAAPDAGFIIPIVLRGGDSVPSRIRENVHFADFSQFSLASADMQHNPAYAQQIRAIASVIYQQYQRFAAADPCTLCTNFNLPPASNVEPWRPTFVNR